MILDSTSQRQGKPQEVDLRDYADAEIQESKPRNRRDFLGRSSTLDSAVDCSDVGSDSDLSFSEDDEEYFAAPSSVDDRVAVQAEKIKEMMSSFNNSSRQKLPSQRKNSIETYETWKSERSLYTASSARSRLSGKSSHCRTSSSMKAKDASGSFDDSAEFSKQSEHSTRHRRKSVRKIKDTTAHMEGSADLSKQSERSTRSRHSSSKKSKDLPSNLDDSGDLLKQSEHSTRHRRSSNKNLTDAANSLDDSADLLKQSEHSTRQRCSNKHVRLGMPEKRASSSRDLYRHFHHGCEANVNETKPERRLSSSEKHTDPATNDNRSDEFKSENRRSSSKHIRLTLPDKAEEENEDSGFLVTRSIGVSRKKSGDFAGFQRQPAGNRRLGMMKSVSFREKGGQMSSLLARTSSRDKITSLPSFQEEGISNRHNEKMSLLDSELSHKAIKAGILTKEQLQQLEVLGIGLMKLR